MASIRMIIPAMIAPILVTAVIIGYKLNEKYCLGGSIWFVYISVCKVMPPGPKAIRSVQLAKIKRSNSQPVLLSVVKGVFHLLIFK